MDIRNQPSNFQGVLQADDFQMVKAGVHPLFGEVLEPDDTKAYVEYTCCACFPNVIGPEMGGRYFGIHQNVLGRSHQSLVHQHTNIGHLMASYGNTRRDHITGCVIATAMPRAGLGANIPEEGADAPRLRVMAVMFKQAQGVQKLLGQHLSGKQKWACSAEIGFRESELGIFDPGDNSITPIDEVDAKVAKALTRDQDDQLQVGQVGGRQLAFALGGTEHTCQFKGLANTPTPAEETAEINDIRASGGVDFDVMAACVPQWIPGVLLRWTGYHAACANRGHLRQAFYAGTHKNRGCVLEGSPENPVLEIELASGTKILRHADTVKTAV